MLSSLRSWLDAIPQTDEVERSRALLVQRVLLVWAVIIIGMMSISVVAIFTGGGSAPADAPPPTPAMLILISLLWVAIIVLCVSPLVGIFILRRGRTARAVSVAVIGFLMAHSVAAFAIGIYDSTVPIMYMVPLVMAGLFGGRRLLWGVAVTNVALIVIIGILQRQGVAGAFGQPLAVQPLANVIIFFVIVTALLVLFLDRSGAMLNGALARSRAREEELRAVRETLQSQVEEQTVELRSALAEVQQRAHEQSALLERVQQQQATINDLSMPAIPIDDQTIVMPLVGNLDGARIGMLIEHGLQAVVRSRTRTLILDITGVPLVDREVAQGVLQMLSAVRLLGSEVVLVGVRPEVAQALVGLDVDLRRMRTFSSLQLALAAVTERQAAHAL